MLPAETVVPATVTVLDKRSLSKDGTVKRIVTVILGNYDWDIYVPENEFAAAMGDVITQAKRARRDRS